MSFSILKENDTMVPEDMSFILLEQQKQIIVDTDYMETQIAQVNPPTIYAKVQFCDNSVLYPSSYHIGFNLFVYDTKMDTRFETHIQIRDEYEKCSKRIYIVLAFDKLKDSMEQWLKDHKII